MRSINKVIIVGNLTRDPEMRQTPSGQSVSTFGVATNRTWMTKGSDKKSEAEYHEMVAWGNLAEICFKYLKKGKLVYIEGYLKTRSWDTPEGVRRFKTEIVVQDMIMLDKRSGEADFDYIPQDSSNEFEINSFDEQEMPSEQVSAPQAAPSPQNSFPNDNQQKNTPTGPIGIDDDLGL